jgi:hypothetical protein
MGISSNLQDRISNLAPRYYDTFDSIETKKKIVSRIGFASLSEDIIKNGSGRSVFDMESLGYPNYCLKMAIPNKQNGGLIQNKNEISVWKSANKQQKDYLCPIVDYDSQKYWLIMKKGDSEVDANIQWYDKAEYVLCDIVLQDDIRKENIIRLDGRFVLCDYGIPNKS